MGTVITLDVGGLELCYSKNHVGINHGALFQEVDRKRTRGRSISDYGARDGLEDDSAELEWAFRRTLRHVKPRLELLGYTLMRAKFEYENYLSSIVDLDEGEASPMSFEELLAFIKSRPLETFEDIYDGGVDFEWMKGNLLHDPRLERIPTIEGYDDNFYSELSYFRTLIDFLHPYLFMRMLCENSDNLRCEVVWEYGPLVDAGWASESDFNAGVERADKILVVTEGTSDALIISQALSILRPDVADFFKFIDAAGHPFSGTGGLTKFAEGLVNIDVQNQIVFVFDNDAEGVEAYGKVGRLKLPSNMRRMCLPDLVDFEDFPVFGPEGEGMANINGKAAAIECYLDLELPGYNPARVAWTNYKQSLKLYHGSLDFKESYTRDFMSLTAEEIKSRNYDFHKVGAVLDALQKECVLMAQGPVL